MSLPLIPVLDLRAGCVVHAVRGERSRYRQLHSALADATQPLALAQALCAAAAATRLYVADLDAIVDGRAQAALLRALHRGLPGVQLWIDAGFGDVGAARALLEAIGPGGLREAGEAGAAGEALVPVFGSESMRDATVLRRLRGAWPQAVLSLDRRGEEPLDPAGCWHDAASWPQRVIVMTLDRVGSQAGPDLARLAEVRRRAPQAELVGAGGARDEADLSAATAAGADAWLVATALHDGRLSRRSAVGAGRAAVDTRP